MATIVHPSGAENRRHKPRRSPHVAGLPEDEAVALSLEEARAAAAQAIGHALAAGEHWQAAAWRERWEGLTAGVTTLADAAKPYAPRENSAGRRVVIAALDAALSAWRDAEHLTASARARDELARCALLDFGRRAVLIGDATERNRNTRGNAQHAAAARAVTRRALGRCPECATKLADARGRHRVCGAHDDLADLWAKRVRELFAAADLTLVEARAAGRGKTVGKCAPVPTGFERVPAG
jgi:hypothetical protein